MARERVGFAAVTGGYLATTTAEWVLPPLFPLLALELGLGVGGAGAMFAILSGSVAVGGLAGGLAIGRLGPRNGVTLALLLVAAGAWLSAASWGQASLVAGQAVLGFGSGAFFVPGIRSAAQLAGPRRGLAIGIFGVAYSGGVALAGLLASLAEAWGWRSTFVAAGALAAGVAAWCVLARLPSRLPAPAGGGGSFRPGAAVAPVVVGGSAAAMQYGAVAFLPLFAVYSWDVSPGTAALVITASRVLSVPAKLLSGNAADRESSVRIARRLGLGLALLGACWTAAPWPGLAIVAAVVFGAFVAALGPVANVLALDAFEGRTHLLGAFRSVQIGFGAATSALIGAGAALFGLQAALVVAAVALPASLIALGRGAHAREESVYS
ncbi:MAG: MFS transporter [Gaiella sp.]|nr:MFS transporter [Gaiella sp.]